MSAKPRPVYWTYDYDSATVRRGREGETEYENTHFVDQRKAWHKLIAKITAGISLGTSARQRAKQELARITSDLADDAERLTLARERFEEWERDRPV